MFPRFRVATTGLLLISTLLLLLSGSVAAAKLPLHAPPAWVQLIPVPLSTPVKGQDISGGYHSLLKNIQHHLASQTEYLHYGFKIFSEEGIQSVSELQFEYDPDYQKLQFHTLRVWRNGKPIDKAATVKYKVIQSEREADRHIYNGRLSAVLILDDVRINDIVEYAYSLQGWNPVHQNKFSVNYYLQSYDPIDEFFLKINTTPEHKLNIKSFHTPVKPAITTAGPQQAYTWHLKNVAGFSFDSDVPSWYDPTPCVYLSEYNSWSEVVNWALPLFAAKEPVSPELIQEVARIKKAYGDSGDRLAATVRFVQDKIRYLGLENGISGYKPFPPSQILRQRFGDCKDKSLLLATMLRQMGIDAYPALVNTNYQDQVKTWLPTAQAFNHCIVLVELPGKKIWIDPTISLQRGQPDSLATPDYKMALVLKAGSQGFTAMQTPKNNKIKVAESFFLDDIGGPVKLEVKTEYFGYDADVQRSKFANSNLKETEKKYLNFYASQYPDITVTRDLAFLDNERENIFTTLEEYSIQDLWNREQKGSDSMLISNFYPQIIRDHLLMPATLIRKMPITLNYPSNVEQAIHIYMPESWPVNTDTKTIRDKSFFYQSNISYQESSRCISLLYQYRNLRDQVPVKEAATYIKNQKAVTSDLGFQISRNLSITEKEFTMNWLMGLIALGTLGLTGFGAYKLYYFNPPAFIPQRAGLPLGGWLVLVMLGLLFSPWRLGLELFSGDYFNLGIWQGITNPGGASYKPALAFILVAEVIINVFLLVYTILLLVLFFRKRSSVPKLITIYYATGLAFVIADAALIQAFELDASNNMFKHIFSSLLGVAIWVPYFNISKRVKETFVNRLHNTRQTELTTVEDPMETEVSV